MNLKFVQLGSAALGAVAFAVPVEAQDQSAVAASGANGTGAAPVNAATPTVQAATDGDTASDAGGEIVVTGLRKS